MDRLERYEVDGRPISIVLAKDRRKTPDEMRPRGGGRRGYSRDRSRDRRSRDRGYSRERRGRSRSRSRDRRDDYVSKHYI